MGQAQWLPSLCGKWPLSYWLPLFTHFWCQLGRMSLLIFIHWNINRILQQHKRHIHREGGCTPRSVLANIFPLPPSCPKTPSNPQLEACYVERKLMLVHSLPSAVWLTGVCVCIVHLGCRDCLPFTSAWWSFPTQTLSPFSLMYNMLCQFFMTKQSLFFVWTPGRPESLYTLPEMKRKLSRLCQVEARLVVWTPGYTTAFKRDFPKNMSNVLDSIQ